MSTTNLLAFQTYLASLRKTRTDQKTEHTDRAALETLLGALAPARITVQHEPKRADDKGSPDFKVTTTGAILGYVEVKTIDADLDAVRKSPQIAKYRLLSKNILLTDYLHFIWLHGDGQIERESLIFPSDLENPKHKLNPDRAAIVAALLQNFFSTAPTGLTRAQELALALATRAHLLREGLATELTRQAEQKTKGKLYGLLEAFRVQVFHGLTLAEFADAFAQMLSYGLFLARLNAEEPLTLANARHFIPPAFPLIAELVDFTTELNAPDYAQIRWIVEEILSILNTLNLSEIRRDLSFANRKSTLRKLRAGSEEEHRLFERDPFVYFYEDFLAKYDKNLRKSRGVYYTPPPVVNFIIRAIDDILKSEFSIPAGLADHKRVTMLDFATGTGTFLLEAFEKMFETIGDSHAKRDLLVREHILKNIFGFEFLIAPYTIAHLKLSQFLADKGHKLAGHDRLQVYLTNTLEPIAPQANYLLPALSEEAEKAQEIKEKPILVITGNPPYSGESKNKGEWISKQIDAYKKVDGAPLGERNPKWLNDDYVKFIRFAQDKIDQVPEGIVGIITNHSFLDNPTFRGMRQSLMTSFDKIYVLDLHGNAKKKEKSPDGSKDENVFDIEQGVSISLFIKTQKPKSRSIHRADFWGPRLGKYESCARLSVKDVGWREVIPATPFYLFESGDAEMATEYRQAHSVTDIFPLNVLGYQTHRDDFAFGFLKYEIENRIMDLRNTNISDSKIREQHPVKDNNSWNLRDARKKLTANTESASNIIELAYGPFDSRWCYYGQEIVDRRREILLNHVVGKDNLCLNTVRQTKSANWKHVLASNTPAPAVFIEIKDGSSIFPLYLYPPDPDKKPKKSDLFGNTDPFAGQSRIENISAAFRATLNERYSTPHLTPEQVFGYIYAILHAPAYRTRYAEFLRGDFPRIPLTATRENFLILSALGWDLAQKHLLKDVPKSSVKYHGKGENLVEKPRYAEAENAVYINATQSFAPVPQNVWDFHIGGYQVIEKYLKSRKNRKLTLEEVDNIENIVSVLIFTIAQMQKIDTAYGAAF